MELYRECREKLARYLASGGAPTPSKSEVEALAYRLWEEAGRPLGRPMEHWFRAEQIVGRRHNAS